MHDIFLEAVCNHCGEVRMLRVQLDDYIDYKNGTPVQKAFPHLSADERELLVSGMCGECFDELFRA